MPELIEVDVSLGPFLYFIRLVKLFDKMGYTLISATPSPYARKVRITLAEKGVPFTLQTEVPWDSTTETPKYNPLEKLPVLIPDNGKPIYESHYILEWIEAKHPAPPMLPQDIDDRLFAKQVEVVADGTQIKARL